MAPRLTDRDRALRSITEREWQKTAEQMLTANGWRFYHAPDNRPGRNGAIQNIKAGFPDLIAVRGTRQLAIELKRETGRATPEQLSWLDDFEAVGAEVYVWRPSDAAEMAAILAPGWHP